MGGQPYKAVLNSLQNSATIWCQVGVEGTMGKIPYRDHFITTDKLRKKPTLATRCLAHTHIHHVMVSINTWFVMSVNDQWHANGSSREEEACGRGVLLCRDGHQVQDSTK